MKYHTLLPVFLLAIGPIADAGEPENTKPIKIEQAEKRLAEGAQLLDVRTEKEWDQGHLSHATLVTVTEDGFLGKAKKALVVKEPVVVYCRSGRRSVIAVERLRAAGFEVYELKGGINAWIEANKPVVRPGKNAD